MKYEETVMRVLKVINSCQSEDQLKYARIYCCALVGKYTQASDLKYWMIRIVDAVVCSRRDYLERDQPLKEDIDMSKIKSMADYIEHIKGVLAMYDEPDREKPCFKCEYRAYDSFHEEMWCAHKPLAECIGGRSLVDKWGSCEYWELCDTYKN